MSPTPFTLGRLPAVSFGEGALERVPEIAAAFGSRVLLVTGRRSFRESPGWSTLTAGLRRCGLRWETLAVPGEPSPALVDRAVREFRRPPVDVVLAVGGGSALDAGKAVAGLLPHGNSVMDHLEGVGRGVPYTGPALPCIAVPTTAGTGSEATKNAVLGERRPGGFKKSFRHECLVPRHAVVDPDLLAGCPPEVIAADGMDALTQLVESYVSARAGPLTDALARSGLEAARDGLFAWYGGGDAAGGRARMAYAALVSGITLAQAGLGAVHGIAAPLGALFPVPHGVACGTLLAAATAANIRALEARDPRHRALERYADVGSLLTGRAHAAGPEARAALVALLQSWTEKLRLPRLGDCGVGASDIGDVVAHSRGSSMRTNPVELTDDEIAAVLTERI